MRITREEVLEMAAFARLRLTESELERFTERIDAMLEYISVIDRLDLSAVEPTPNAISAHNVFRSDEIGPTLALSDVLANAPDHGYGFFRVPRVVEGSQ